MLNFNQELVKKGATDKEIESILQKNIENINFIKQFIPYDKYDLFQEVLENYEKLINKYSKYAYLLGYTRAIYQKK